MLDAMTKTLEQLTAEALAFPSISRPVLAEKLLENLEFDLDPEKGPGLRKLKNAISKFRTLYHSGYKAKWKI